MPKILTPTVLVLCLATAVAPAFVLAQSTDPRSWLEPERGSVQWTGLQFLPREGYAVQLGVYSSRQSLANAVSAPPLAGIKLHAVAVPHDGGERFHLLYGPYQFRDNAETVAAQLKTWTGMDNWVRSLASLRGN